MGTNIHTMSDELGEELWFAAAYGKKAKAQELLRRNADVNHVTCAPFCRDTPLHQAAVNNHPAMVQLLLEHGADRNLKDCEGDTALDDAKYQNNTDCVRLLDPAAAAKEAAAAQAAQMALPSLAELG